MPSAFLTRPPRLTFVAGLLVLTLGVAGALAWQAHQAARSHQAAALGVQQDYVEFAGWEFSRAARAELDSRLDQWLQTIGCAASGGRLPRPSDLDTGTGCRCDDLQARTLFRIDVRTEGLSTTGQPLGPEAERWVRGVANGAHRLPGRHPARLVRIGIIDGAPRVLAAGPAHDRFGAPTTIAGFTADPAVFAPAFSALLKETPLLPPSLAGQHNDLLDVSVVTPDGAAVFETGRDESAARAEGTLPASLGELRYTVSLRPEGAERLVIGGLPRSRLPVLLGLLGLTAALIAAAVVQLRREQDLARLRADFVASVSHELRTPLAQVRLFSETLLLGRVRSEVEGRRSLEIIHQESGRLTHLIENVLYFSRAERRAQRVLPTPVRLSTLAAELLEGFAPIARSGRAETRLDVRADMVAPVDSGAVRQILLNLLDNAIKYGPAGQTVVVTVDGIGEHARIAVEDEGPGVPADARSRIWEPYSRLASAATSGVAGTGIGLAVVRELVELHGGRAWVEDGAHGGARFVIELPGARLAAPDASEPAARASRIPA